MTITLYGMGPSRSFRAVWAAEEAELDYQYIEVELGGSKENGSSSDHYRAINSQGKVPALVEDDFVLTESAAIVNYLANKVPEKKLIPTQGTKAAGRYDQICYFIVTEFEQPLWTNGKHLFALPEEYRVPHIMEKTTHFEFEKAQTALVKLLSNNIYAIGDTFTMADILLAQTTSWAQNFKFAVDDKLLMHRDKMKQRDAFQRAKKTIGK